LEKFRSLQKFDYNDIAVTHKIMKRDVGIAYIAMRKIHYNVMRLKETLSIDEAEVLARSLALYLEGIMYYMIQKS
jgi:hypothetical protein